MASLDVKKLSEAIKSKRGSIGLRAASEDIGGITATTLSRIERGHLPDIDTFLKICKWLNASPDFFTVKDNKEKEPKQREIVAFLRADKTLSRDTAEMLIKMIGLAYKSGGKSDGSSRK